MVKMLLRFGITISIIYVTAKWLIIPIVTTKISEAGLVTALICSFVIMLTVVIPFVLKE